MKIINTNFAFKALLGKNTTTWYHGDNYTSIEVEQIVHPFKDEFRSKNDQQLLKDNFTNTSYCNKHIGRISASDGFGRGGDCVSDIKVVFAPPLPYTKEEFEQAVMNNQNLQLPDGINVIETRHVGNHPYLNVGKNGSLNLIG